MDFFGAEVGTIEQLIQARHELFGGLGVQKSDVGERLFPVLQQTRDLFAYLRSTQPLVGDPPRQAANR